MKPARPTVGVDIDGVLGNQVQGVLDRVNDREGLSLKYEDVVEWDVPLGSTTFTTEIKQAMQDEGYVLGMPVRVGAAEMLAALHDHWTIKVLTVRPPEAMQWTREWLDKNDLRYDELLQSKEGEKGESELDALIDDLPKNLAGLLRNKPNGRGILVDQPWNRTGEILEPLERWLEDWRLTRVSRLTDIPEILSQWLRLPNRLELSVSDCAREKAGRFDIEALYARATSAREHAYAPYSQFRVGAALLTANGEIITAGNVENSSFSLTICAERAAVVRAVAEGYSDFEALAIAGDTDRAHTVASCGACLQVLAEFDPDGVLLVAFPDGNVLRVTCLSELLPVRFRLQAG